LVGHKVALQGNLDPAVLFASPEVITAEVHKILSAFGRSPGHVFNLGHGISQFTPPENALALVEAVHSLSQEIRESEHV
ncbi:MAG TPA: uroporphyrinogen decarboxylase family protein, partial [Nitrosospira sp.]